MKIYEYIPACFEGEQARVFEVNTKDELLSLDICKRWIDRGYAITVSPSGVQEIEGGKLIAFKRISDKQGDIRFYVVAFYKTYDEEFLLCKWLPIFEHALRSPALNVPILTRDRSKWIDDAFDYHNKRIQHKFNEVAVVLEADIELTKKLRPLYEQLDKIYTEHEKANSAFRKTLQPEALQGYGGQTPQYDGPTQLPWSTEELEELSRIESEINRLKGLNSDGNEVSSQTEGV